MNSYETVNNILVRLFKDILDIEERALITSEYKDISVNDMHIMEAIGIQESKNMSTVAKTMSVTDGNADDCNQPSCEKRLCRTNQK